LLPKEGEVTTKGTRSRRLEKKQCNRAGKDRFYYGKKVRGAGAYKGDRSTQGNGTDNVTGEKHPHSGGGKLYQMEKKGLRTISKGIG